MSRPLSAADRAPRSSTDRPRGSRAPWARRPRDLDHSRNVVLLWLRSRQHLGVLADDEGVSSVRARRARQVVELDIALRPRSRRRRIDEHLRRRLAARVPVRRHQAAIIEACAATSPSPRLPRRPLLLILRHANPARQPRLANLAASLSTFARSGAFESDPASQRVSGSRARRGIGARGPAQQQLYGRSARPIGAERSRRHPRGDERDGVRDGAAGADAGERPEVTCGAHARADLAAGRRTRGSTEEHPCPDIPLAWPGPAPARPL